MTFTIGGLIILGLAVAELLTVVKLGKQDKRIEKLEKRVTKEKGK